MDEKPPSCCPGCEGNLTPLLVHTYDCGKEAWILPPSQPRPPFHLMLFHPVFQTVAGLSLFVLLANLYLAPVLTLLLVVRGRPLANVERILVGLVGCWLVRYLPTMYADFLELFRMVADRGISHFRIVMAHQGYFVPPDWGVRDLGQESGGCRSPTSGSVRASRRPSALGPVSGPTAPWASSEEPGQFPSWRRCGGCYWHPWLILLPQWNLGGGCPAS